MRLLLAAIFFAVGTVPSFAQTSNSAAQARMSRLAGTYKLVTPCVECDSTLNQIKLECDPGCKSGTYSTKSVNIYDEQRKVMDRRSGDWFVLPADDSAKNDDVLVIVFDMLGGLETYPLYMVTKDGELFKLRQPNPEHFPTKVIKRNGKLYIANKHHKPLSLDRATKYKDYPFMYTYKKQ